MPYKDPEKKRECARRWYYNNKDKPEFKEKMKIKEKERYLKNKQKMKIQAKEITQRWKNIYQMIKEKYGCLLCKENRGACLDFHHLNSDIKGDIVSKMINAVRKHETIIPEIKKCIVLCSNCHRLHHAGELKVPLDVSTIDVNFEEIDIINKALTTQ